MVRYDTGVLCHRGSSTGFTMRVGRRVGWQAGSQHCRQANKLAGWLFGKSVVWIIGRVTEAFSKAISKTFSKMLITEFIIT